MSAPVIEPVVLTGRFVRLEPLTLTHVPALDAAASEDRATYDWTPVPDGEAAHRRYVENMIAEHAAGTRLAFATVRIDEDRPGDGRVVGTTSYLDPQRWPGGARWSWSPMPPRSVATGSRATSASPGADPDQSARS